MTCHGDQGQGLTDEFRDIWESDHQNCWARGCYAGRSGDFEFPIPTIVPTVVDDDHLSQFASLQDLADFLKATHPPQSLRILKAEEYYAIAFFVFSMNGISGTESSLAAIPVSTATEILISIVNSPVNSKVGKTYTLVSGLVVLALLSAAVIIVLVRIRHRGKDDTQADDL